MEVVGSRCNDPLFHDFTRPSHCGLSLNCHTNSLELSHAHGIKEANQELLEPMVNHPNKLAALLASAVVCLSLGTPAKAQVSADALLDKLVAKGILKPDEAEELKTEAATTNNNPKGLDFKLSHAIKSAEIFGDVRMRYEYRSAKLGPEAGPYAGGYDTADRWRYAVRLGVRGDLVDDFYYGLRLETGAE